MNIQFDIFDIFNTTPSLNKVFLLLHTYCKSTIKSTDSYIVNFAQILKNWYRNSKK